ncbi:MAG: hypothetical protein INQ03_06695 [Candidatus Heimdallarchaeota archaeon]|nr:hypothetical protein [Candidatus Heimdallarchaeota archaeon]
MVLEIKINEAKIMKEVVDALQIAHNEVHIKFEDHGFRAQTQSMGSSILTDIYLNKECFDTYNVKETIVLRVDLESFGGFIKMARSNDELTIGYNEVEQQLMLSLSSESIDRHTSIRLLGDDQENSEDYRFLNILDSKFHSNAKILASLLIDAIKVATFGEGKVEINHSAEGIKFTNTSENHTKTAEAMIKYNDTNASDIEVFSGPIKTKQGAEVEIPKIHEANYDLESLKLIPKTIKSNETIVFSIMHQGPLRIVSEIAGGNGHIAIALSPIIERTM